MSGQQQQQQRRRQQHCDHPFIMLRQQRHLSGTPRARAPSYPPRALLLLRGSRAGELGRIRKGKGENTAVVSLLVFAATLAPMQRESPWPGRTLCWIDCAAAAGEGGKAGRCLALTHDHYPSIRHLFGLFPTVDSPPLPAFAVPTPPASGTGLQVDAVRLAGLRPAGRQAGRQQADHQVGLSNLLRDGVQGRRLLASRRERRRPGWTFGGDGAHVGAAITCRRDLGRNRSREEAEEPKGPVKGPRFDSIPLIASPAVELLQPGGSGIQFCDGAWYYLTVWIQISMESDRKRNEKIINPKIQGEFPDLDVKSNNCRQSENEDARWFSPSLEWMGCWVRGQACAHTTTTTTTTTTTARTILDKLIAERDTGWGGFEARPVDAMQRQCVLDGVGARQQATWGRAAGSSRLGSCFFFFSRPPLFSVAGVISQHAWAWVSARAGAGGWMGNHGQGLAGTQGRSNATQQKRTCSSNQSKSCSMIRCAQRVIK
ncbi:hypothetical protein GGTG_01087 [Gaeumannomyces tritici R3-111a-1]|uniref:Uncharacterized protein n=1 Tax=Gaeumannomyces tritici (strain R3-111a-1) TaxID=644352 RepID=J3NIK8_GAET3|nr:hypothetical protein GGTG_01087 [Gaeumannomyces tritici R3-111a-1]EJT81101.1 hypothetical protein GGTG_01087 [Gaeumannomyces tritici R3-111a-1]